MRKQRLIFIFLSVALLCCAVILSLSKEAVAFTLPDTGQTKCYDTLGVEIACTGQGAYTGQDGAYNINPMSYTDNGNGTITDNVTGLVWQKGENSASGTYYNWYVASGTYDATNNPSSQNVCGSLTLGGQSGWRLPTNKGSSRNRVGHFISP